MCGENAYAMIAADDERQRTGRANQKHDGDERHQRPRRRRDVEPGSTRAVVGQPTRGILAARSQADSAPRSLGASLRG